MSERLFSLFPKLAGSRFKITSPQTRRYNCLAWAAGEEFAWWWPDRHFDYYWPESAPRVETLDAFKVAYSTLGYQECPTPECVAGLEKVAVYADRDGTPTHAARQLESGLWTSKLGGLEDIEHDLEGLEGAEYGRPALFMSRPRKNAPR